MSWLRFPVPYVWRKRLRFYSSLIDPAELLRVETDHHITVLEHPIQSPVEFCRFLAHAGHRSAMVKVGHLSYFKRPDCDVVHVELSSPDIARIRADLSKELDTKLPSFIPHMTIAYVRRGQGKAQADRVARMHGSFQRLKLSKLRLLTDDGDDLVVKEVAGD